MKKLNILWIMLFFVSFVSAGTPTQPSTLAPLDNSVFFNAPTLTCSGSTEPDGLSLNYTFFTTGTGGNSSWFNQVQSFTTGTGYADPNRLQSNGGGHAGITTKVNFSSSWTVQLKAEGDNGASQPQNVSIYDGLKWSTIWMTQDDFNTQSVTFDTGNWSGTEASVKFSIFSQSSHPARQFYFWWDSEDSVVLQNDSRTTYYWENITSPTEETWYCKGCNWQNCSSATTNKNLYMANFESCSSGNVALSFNLFDEEVSTTDLGNFSFDSSWTLTSNIGDVKSFNFGEENKSFYNYCLSPNTITTTLDGF